MSNSNTPSPRDEKTEFEDAALTPGEALSEHLEALSAWSEARVQAFHAAQKARFEAQQAPSSGAKPQKP